MINQKSYLIISPSFLTILLSSNLNSSSPQLPDSNPFKILCPFLFIIILISLNSTSKPPQATYQASSTTLTTNNNWLSSNWIQSEDGLKLIQSFIKPWRSSLGHCYPSYHQGLFNQLIQLFICRFSTVILFSGFLFFDLICSLLFNPSLFFNPVILVQESVLKFPILFSIAFWSLYVLLLISLGVMLLVFFFLTIFQRF